MAAPRTPALLPLLLACALTLHLLRGGTQAAEAARKPPQPPQPPQEQGKGASTDAASVGQQKRLNPAMLMYILRPLFEMLGATSPAGFADYDYGSPAGAVRPSGSKASFLANLFGIGGPGAGGGVVNPSYGRQQRRRR